MTHDNFPSFLEAHTQRIEPLSRDLHLAYWDATNSGRREDFERFERLDIEYQTLYNDAGAFSQLERWRDDGTVTDPVERRVLDVLYRSYLRNQIDPELIDRMTRLSSKLINTFNVYRASVDGCDMTSNEVRTVLRGETDSDRRRRVWEADKGVGAVVRDDLLELIRARNQAAHSLGFENYYVMSLELSEQNPEELAALFDRLEALTREPFREVKTEVDSALAHRYGIDAGELRPWHYEDPFFQEAPRVGDVDLDSYYRGKDVVALVARFFEDMGLEVGDIIERSSLYEQPGKEQHAYCMDIDRRGDIRVLANVKDDEMWTGTMLHELGHGVYDRYIDDRLPFFLREHAHIFATEAIAMLFGRLSKDAGWMQAMLGLDDATRGRIEASVNTQQRLGQLVFARWCQVMVRFERALYADPDGDLDTLWWELVERMQMISSPEGRRAPDWASKIHMVTAPVYYHNYMLGELLASQLDRYIHAKVLRIDSRSALVGETRVGKYLKDRVFDPGKRLPPEEMIQQATGESLTPDYFVAQFVS